MAIADFQCQLINIITQKKDIYKLIYSVLYLCIIIMICTFIYWDSIYKSAKKYSKCNNISKIIDENYYNETPYVYNIIIINTKNIKKLSEFIIKITYDFHKMVTYIEYGNTEDEKNIFIYRINDYIAIIKEINKLEKKKDSLKNSKKNVDLVEYNKIALEYSELIKTDEGKKALELNNSKDFINSFKYTYYNLDLMTTDIIEDISRKINSNDYKYYAVDKNYNIIQSYTTNELIKFTKGYSNNPYYPITIIDYIIFSKMHQKYNIDI